MYTEEILLKSVNCNFPSLLAELLALGRGILLFSPECAMLALEFFLTIGKITQYYHVTIFSVYTQVVDYCLINSICR